MKKIWEILQKEVRFHFFPIKIKQTLFPLGELAFYLKVNFFFFIFVVPLVTRCHFFCWWLWEARDEVITGKKLTAFNFMAKMLDKVPSRLKEALAFPTSFSLFFSFNKITFYFELILPEKPWDWESCREAVRKFKNSDTHRRIVRAGRSVTGHLVFHFHDDVCYEWIRLSMI